MGIRKSFGKNKKSRRPAAAMAVNREETIRRAARATAEVGGPDMAPHTPQALGSAPAKPWRSSTSRFVHGL